MTETILARLAPRVPAVVPHGHSDRIALADSHDARNGVGHPGGAMVVVATQVIAHEIIEGEGVEKTMIVAGAAPVGFELLDGSGGPEHGAVPREVDTSGVVDDGTVGIG